MTFSYANIFAHITFLKVPGVRVVLQIQAIGNDDINADLAEELL